MNACKFFVKQYNSFAIHLKNPISVIELTFLKSLIMAKLIKP